ncbi:MAG: glycosyltransferase [Candidatus Humimicrobiaceae bacterium]
MREVFFWIIFPCFLQMNTYRELAKIKGIEVNVICQEDVSEYRKMSYGWTCPEPGQVNLEILPSENWKDKVIQILEKNKTAIHVFGSILPDYPEKIAYARDTAFSMDLKTGIITEAPINAETRLIGKSAKYLRNLFNENKIRRIANKSKFVLAIPNKKYAYFRKLGWNKDQIFPFGYFVTKGRIEQNSLPKWARRVEEVDLMKVKILFAGTFAVVKSPDLLVRALALLHKKGSEFICYMIGDGQQESYLKDLVQKNGLSDKVIFFGVRPNDQYRALMKTCDIVAVSQRRASWGTPALEAIQSGIAVIISDGDGASELIKISGAGRVFKSGNLSSLYLALYDLINSRKNLEEAKKKAALFAVKVHPFTMAEYLNKVLLYAEGLSANRPVIPWLDNFSEKVHEDEG